MIAALALAAAAPALTAAEAQTLPLTELARRVLGAAGAVAIAVDRPRWPTCEGFCGTSPAQDGPPPLDILTFHTRAEPLSAAGWAGLCVASPITVSFAPDGTVSAVRSATTVGWTGALEREQPIAGPGDLERKQAQTSRTGARCAALVDTRGFVGAGGGLFDTAELIVAVALLHDSLALGGTLPLTCGKHLYGGRSCATSERRRDLAGAISVDAISSVFPAASDRHQPAGSRCYDVRLAQPIGLSDTLALCLRAETDHVTVLSARFDRVQIVY